MTNSKKIAGTLAALMMSAGIAFAPTASFAATQHDGHAGAKSVSTQQVAMYGKYRDGKNTRDVKYDRDAKHDGQMRHHRYTDRDHRPAQRFEKISLEKHPGFAFFAGHWVWQMNHWHWIAGTWQHR